MDKMIIYVVILLIVVFFLIALYFYKKMEASTHKEAEALKTSLETLKTLTDIMPRLNKIINENIPIETPYSNDQSTENDRVYDTSIDKKILGDNYEDAIPMTNMRPKLIK